LIFPEREYYLGKMGNDLPPKPAPKAEEVKEVIYAEGETLSSDFFLNPEFDGRIPADKIPTASAIAMKTGKAVIVNRKS